MRVLDALTEPWAITPEKLQVMLDVYDRHLRGELADLAAIEAAMGRPLDNTQKGYAIVPDTGVAVLPLTGVLSKRMSLMQKISGGASMQSFQQDLQATLDDQAVEAILLLVDSPGGEIGGLQATAQAVRAAAQQKPMAAVADGVMASAAYWIGSAVGAGNVYAAEDTTAVGSIGVVAAHVDRSEMDRRVGLKVTEITAGKYKRIASEHAPLTPDGAATLQEMVDHIYSVFVDEVAANRRMSAEQVLAQMADGRIFLGKKAQAAGLVDGIASLADVVQKLQDRADQVKQYGASALIQTGAEAMKVTILGAECTTQEQVDAAVAAGLAKASTDAEAAKAAGIEAARAEGLAAGAAAERQRIQDVEANAMPGHEALLAELKADGKTTGPEAAQRMLAAEKARVGQIAANLKADAPPAAPAAPPPAAEGTKPEPDPKVVAAQAQAYQDEEKKAGRMVSTAQAVAHVMKEQGQK